MAQNLKEDTASRPMDKLKSEARGLIGALGDRAMSSVRDKVEGATGRLTDYVEGGAGPGLMAAVTGAKDLAEGKSPARSLLGAGMTAAKEKVGNLFGKGKGGGKGKKLKVTNIVESIDVGVPLKLAYNQWTQFADFPSFMKKIENVEQSEEQKLNWKAQVFWSHRTWESTILEQTPDDKIVWRSKGEKGHVDGAVTFHELAPSLTRILLVLEYHPQGMFEHTGNLWRAQGRRARLELKHFRRHVMSDAILHPDEIEGWRGVIHDGEVVQDHESALREEQESNDEETRNGSGQRDSDQPDSRSRSRAAADGEQEDDEDLGEERSRDQNEYVEDEEGDESDSDDRAEPDDRAESHDRAESDDDDRAESDDDDRAESDDGDRAESERPARSRTARAPARRRRPAERPQRSGRSSHDEDGPQRTVRRAAARGGQAK